MRSIIPIRFALVIATTLLAHGAVVNAASQTETTQDVCVGEPTERDVFSVGELRTSMLPQTAFQEMNGAEWVLADGRPLLVQTALSPHLLQESEHGLTILDVRGRFLRMANNNVCADLRSDEEAHSRCIESRDRDGDRLLGGYQADAFAGHAHGIHTHNYNDVYFAESHDQATVDILNDGRQNNIGNGSPWG